MIAKVGVAVIGAILLIPVVIAAGVSGAISAVFGSGSSPLSVTALADIPADYLALYRAATGVCPGLDWSILAAIGKIETDHGRSTLPGVSSGDNASGAGGPMQFLQSSFDGVLARHTIPRGGANPPSRYNPHDAIHAAAHYLCDSGAPKDLYNAIFAYNHADWYVKDVLAQAKRYSETSNMSAACPDLPPIVQSDGRHVSDSALAAVRFACAQLGKPYVWGGNGDPGFDCSGLTREAYASAGVMIPRTAQTQYDAGPLLPAGSPLLPGDLVFFGTPTQVHHVGISLGGYAMVHAPTFGQPVRVGDPRSHNDLLAASRPSIR